MTGKLPLVPFVDLKVSSLCFFPSHSNSKNTISLKPNFTPKTRKIYSTNQTQTPISNQDEIETKSWEESKQILSSLNFSLEDSNKMLKKAFGFTNSPYWSEERKKETPNPQKVNEILDFLKSLGLSEEELHKVLKKFPEVLGCDLAKEMRVNVQLLEKDWGISGKTLKSLVLRNPKVLGFNVDCKGDCMAQCTRCWVRF